MSISWRAVISNHGLEIKRARHLRHNFHILGLQLFTTPRYEHRFVDALNAT